MSDGNTGGKGGGPGVYVPARTVPAPPTISPAAQAYLANPSDTTGGPLPAVDDKEAWRAWASVREAFLTERMAINAEKFPAQTTWHTVSASGVYEIEPQDLAPDLTDCAMMFLHGGGFVLGSGIRAAYAAMPLAAAAGIRTFSVDYRMPPDHPFPAGLEDTVEAYRWLLDRFAPDKIVVVGQSAGGGLAAGLILKARELGLPVPGGCVLWTPAADMTESGDTFETNFMVDVALKERLPDLLALYANGHDPRDPYLSPVFGDFSGGFSPTMLISGTRDMLLSNTVILHRAMLRAGVEAELHVWEAMPHVGFSGAPEDDEVISEQVRFIRKRLCPQ